MYEEVSTSDSGETEDFSITIGLLQGSILSPYFFTLNLDLLTEHIQELPSRYMFFADDIVLFEESKEDLNQSW